MGCEDPNQLRGPFHAEASTSTTAVSTQQTVNTSSSSGGPLVRRAVPYGASRVLVPPLASRPLQPPTLAGTRAAQLASFFTTTAGSTFGLAPRQLGGQAAASSMGTLTTTTTMTMDPIVSSGHPLFFTTTELEDTRQAPREERPGLGQ